MGALAYTDERWRITSARYEEMIRSGALTDEDRVELLEGEVVPMSPLGTWRMARTYWVRECVARAFGDSWAVAQGIALDLPGNSRPEPDVVVVSRDALRATGRPSGTTLVVEVADSSLGRERRKAALYAAGNIVEYWIVNRPNDVVEVHREPIPAPTSPTGFEYRSVQMLRRGESVQALQATAPVTIDELLGEPSDLP